MLQNFTNEEITGLLDTGTLCLDGPCKESRWIERVENGQYQLVCDDGYDSQGSPLYRKLPDLLFCEYISFDDIRTKWYYNGVLLDSPKFQEKLV